MLCKVSLAYETLSLVTLQGRQKRGSKTRQDKTDFNIAASVLLVEWGS